MPIYLRAYLFVLVLGLIGFYLLKKAYVPAGLTQDAFDRRRKVWFLITSIAFLSGNFWIFAIACAIAVQVAARKEANEFALFVALLFAVPPITRVIPGFGPLEYLIPLTHQRILSFCILAPLALKLFKDRHSRPRGARLPDVMVGLYLGYICLVSLVELTLQSSLRTCLYAFLDIGLLYYVASRSVRTIERFREVIVVLLVALSLAAFMSIFEAFRSWWLYETLTVPFNAGIEGGYHKRGDMNLLRAMVTAGHPIILGLVMGVGLMLQLSVGALVTSGKWRLTTTLLLIAGCIMPLSRGPWVGTAAGAIVLVITGPGRGKRIGYAVLATATGALILSFTSFGRSIYRLLPVFGDSSTDGSVHYREQLLDVSMEVWKQNLWFGDQNFMRNPMLEVMRQGEGIIDMVNTYLSIGLSRGLIGLTLFVGCALACWTATSVRTAAGDEECLSLLAFQRGLRASIVTVLVTLATVSDIGLAPAMLWIVLGLAAGMPRLGGKASKVTQPRIPAKS